MCHLYQAIKKEHREERNSVGKRREREGEEEGRGRGRVRREGGKYLCELFGCRSLE
jgi:hypothetical protein